MNKDFFFGSVGAVQAQEAVCGSGHTQVVWVPVNLDVGMQVFQVVLGPRGRHGHGLCDLLVYHDEDTHALFGLALQDAVEAVPWEQVRRAA